MIPRDGAAQQRAAKARFPAGPDAVQVADGGPMETGATSGTRWQPHQN
jgi:hypothetical protein